MTDSVEAKIATLLLSRVAALSITPPLSVSYPGVSFTPPAGTYLEVNLIPNTNVNRGLGSTDSTQFRGILQVTVVAPANGGIIAPTSIAGKIADHFERGTALADGTLQIKISGRPSIAPPIQDPDRISIPVSVNWYAFH